MIPLCINSKNKFVLVYNFKTFATIIWTFPSMMSLNVHSLFFFLSPMVVIFNIVEKKKSI